MSLDPILDDLFHGCALAAFVEMAAMKQGSPCPESTRQLAYSFYENELRRKHSSKSI